MALSIIIYFHFYWTSMVLDLLAELRLGGLLRSASSFTHALMGSFSVVFLFADLVSGLMMAFCTAILVLLALAHFCPPRGQWPDSGVTVSIARAAQVSRGRRAVGVPRLGAPGVRLVMFARLWASIFTSARQHCCTGTALRGRASPHWSGPVARPRTR